MIPLFNFLKKNGQLNEILISKLSVNGDSHDTSLYTAVVTDSNHTTRAQGTGASIELAKQIALAECAERTLVRVIYQDERLREQFFLDLFPTTCGFAAGYDSASTQCRALCEGLERWIWSKWIDDQFAINQISLPNEHSLLTKVSLEHFDEVWCFEHKLYFPNPTNIGNFHFVSLIGLTNEGAFAGSKVCSLGQNPFEHAAVEASRNYLNSRFYEARDVSKIPNNIIVKRAEFFAKNRFSAIKQMQQSKKTGFPHPELLTFQEFSTKIENVFLWRCLMKDFIGWHEGGVDRFVY